MKRTAARLIAAMAISTLPMASIATAALMISADTAFAAGKTDKGGKSSDRGKPDKGGKPEGRGKPESGASVLKGLNSLKRNINGLMNSSDPKMAGFQSYLLASAALAEFEELLATAQGEYDAAETAYLELGLDTATEAAAHKTAMEAELAGLDPESEEYAALSSKIATVQTYITESVDLSDAKAAVETATEGTTEEDMLQAFVDAMHASGQTDFTLDDITDEMLALFQLHIDDYLD